MLFGEVEFYSAENDILCYKLRIHYKQSVADDILEFPVFL